MAPKASRTLTCPDCNRTYTLPTGRSSGAHPRCDAAEQATLTVIAEEMHRLANEILQGIYNNNDSAKALSHCAPLRKLCEDYEAAAVARGRARGETWESLGAHLRISANRIRKRWPNTRLRRVLASRQPSPPAGTLSRRGRPSPGTGDGDTPQAMSRGTRSPQQQLASALSHLVRRSGRTSRDIAADARIDPSYVSRILAGTRRPSWPVIERLLDACRPQSTPPDPVTARLREDVRLLWEAAHRSHSPALAVGDNVPARRATQRFTAELRALYTAAGSPPPEAVGRDIDPQVLQTALAGETIPDWDTCGRIIFALRGRPADLRPLWAQAHHDTSTQHNGPPAGAFG
ncbi:helix-turn-helix domain-containing protein [Streptomyces sp. NPDC057638]|uniref:helix-turn-helix domain-containing protein n=1 Tax=Streptomyces sp. NPDC057638 TaxID=3346190 RepID=UPI0036A8A498